ncbi:MAG: hypothetical protein ACI4VU_06275 [Methanobrevibacter sp.]
MKNILKSFLLSGGTQIGGALWFICILIKISFLYCFNDFFIKKVWDDTIVVQGVISSLLLILGFFMHLKSISLLSLDKVFSYYCLFYIGYVLKRYKLCDCIKKDCFRFLVLISMFVILFLCNLYGYIELAETSYMNPFFLLMTSIAGWQLMYEISFFISKTNKIKNVLIVIGKNTLSVVILHFLCFKIINLLAVYIECSPLFLISCFLIYKRSGVWWLLYCLIGIELPVFLSILYKTVRKAINKRCLQMNKIQ